MYLPGACPGAHLAGYVDVTAQRAVDLQTGGGSRAEGTDAREVRAWLDAAPVAAGADDGRRRGRRRDGGGGAGVDGDGDGDGGKMSAGSKQSSRR